MIRFQSWYTAQTHPTSIQFWVDGIQKVKNKTLVAVDIETLKNRVFEHHGSIPETSFADLQNDKVSAHHFGNRFLALSITLYTNSYKSMNSSR